MKKYQIPQSIIDFRLKRFSMMVRIAKFSIAIRVFLVLIEMTVFSFYTSTSLLMDSLSLSLDIVASIFFLICIRFAAKPPDSDHPFGHGRAEPLIGMQLGLIMIVIGIIMLFQQTAALFSSSGNSMQQKYLWVVPLLAACCLEFGYQILKRAAKKHKSPALLAESSHFRIDALGSIIAFFALAFASVFSEIGRACDQIGGCFIAILMIILGFKAALKNIHQLVDRIPSEEYFSLVEKAALAVKEVKATEKIRLQVYGPHAHVNIDIEVHPKMNVLKSHEIAKEVRLAIQKAWPMVQDVIVHVEPYQQKREGGVLYSGK